MGGGCQYVCDEAVDVLLAEMECSKNVWCSLEERERASPVATRQRKMKLRQLESWLQQANGFADPKMELEQYATSPQIAGLYSKCRRVTQRHTHGFFHILLRLLSSLS